MRKMNTHHQRLLQMNMQQENLFLGKTLIGQKGSWVQSFFYNGHYYRLCNEPKGCEPKGARGQFHVLEMIFKNGEKYPGYDHYDEIGWYASLYEVLNECWIQNRPFREVIMDPDTEILG